MYLKISNAISTIATWEIVGSLNGGQNRILRVKLHRYSWFLADFRSFWCRSSWSKKVWTYSSRFPYIGTWTNRSKFVKNFKSGRRRPNFFLNWSFRRARNDSGVELAIFSRFDPENSNFNEIRRKLFPRPVRKVGQLWAAVNFEPEEISPRKFHHSMRHDLS